MHSQIIGKAQSGAGRGASRFDFASRRHGMFVRSGSEHARPMVRCDETVIGMHCSRQYAYGAFDDVRAHVHRVDGPLGRTESARRVQRWGR
jgi:hypothetical protein